MTTPVVEPTYKSCRHLCWAVSVIRRKRHVFQMRSPIPWYQEVACHYFACALPSYDERLALWDVRSVATPLKELPLGGGIWRLKWHPRSVGLLAAACMHNHFALVDARLGSGEPMEVVERYKGHASLAYGVDWCRKIAKETFSDSSTTFTCTLASCSFYDHSMHVWNAQLHQNC